MTATSTNVNASVVRRQFPAFERRVNGHSAAYFDAPGGTQVPQGVAAAVRDYLLHHNANTHWAYPTSAETDAMLVRAREASADLLGARPDEIAFGANMTTLTFHVARGLARGWRAGDEIIVTELDHHANVAPWQAVARDAGLVLRTAPLRADRRALDMDALAGLINARTRLVAAGAASNAIGTVSDVPAIAGMAHAAGALLFVDAVHFAPHALVDVRAVGADLLACSAYKFYGPHVGMLYVRHDMAGTLDVPKLMPAPDAPPERFETGTLNHEGIAGVEAAIDFLASLGGGKGSRRDRLAASYRWLHDEGERLVAQLWRGLSAIRGVTLYGLTPGEAPRTPTVAFTLRGLSSREVAAALAKDGVFVSHGDFYASTVVERLGFADEGLVRAGCACYTTDDEVERLLSGVAQRSARSA